MPQPETLPVLVDTLLDSLADAAALILPDKRILRINCRLAQVIGPAKSGICYQVLAGLPDPCPFCPLEDMISGSRALVKDTWHMRWNRNCRVSVCFLPGVGEKGLILETIRQLDENVMDRAVPTTSQETFPRLSPKLSGLVFISRELMAPTQFPQRMANVLKQIVAALSDPSDSNAWAELDDTVYGTSSEHKKGVLSVHEVRVEGQSRGRLCFYCPNLSQMDPDDEYFLQDATDLIGRQLAIADLEAQLRQSEEQYKKLAANLRKEVWTRTEALAKETGYLEGILRSSDDMIITTDLEGRIVEFNPAAERILGYSPEEIHGRPATDVWVDGEERDRIMELVRASGAVRNYKTRLQAKSGEIREISLTLSLLKDSEGVVHGTVGVSKDVSRENAIRRELEKLNQSYRETIHFISHEAKNSLIVIAGFVRRLLESEPDPRRKEQLEVVYHHAKFLEAMTRDYLIMAELEHGHLQVRKERIADFYQEVILPAMVGLKERYPDSFQSYDESMGGVRAVSLMGDRGLLEIVYRNLFGNALKYRSVNGKIAYGVVDRGDCYEFNVWNEGPGVETDQTERIFDKFYRVPSETTRDKKGTGLGLYNLRRIIEGHRGTIWCESRPGAWINFIFRLPKEWLFAVSCG